MKISNRLEIIASLIENCQTVLDVGTDHAYLPIYLINNAIADNVIASDNKTGPLTSAKKNIDRFALSSKIKLILSDGLTNIDDKFDVLVIAGMGGSVIHNILTMGNQKLESCFSLILQPNNHDEKVREFLVNNNYQIIDEIMVKEDKHYYPIIKAVKGKSKLNDLELYYGPILLQKKPEIFIEYLQNKRDYLQSIIKDISSDSLNHNKITSMIIEIDNILD